MFHLLIGIIDIGSTGTRFNIFTFLDNKKLLHHEKYEVKGGLHKMSHHQIKKNLESLKCQLPDIAYKIPVGIYCTAGFRHPLNYKKLEYIRQNLKELNVREYGIISGKYEGYLGYQSLKYRLNRSNFILIDMGGKSTQVVMKDYYKSYRVGNTNIGKIKYMNNIKPILSNNKYSRCNDNTYSTCDGTQVKHTPTASMLTIHDNTYSTCDSTPITSMLTIHDKLQDNHKINKDMPIFISSKFTKKGKIKYKKIKNKNFRRLLRKLGLMKNLKGVKVNWTLGMAIRLLQNT